MSYFQLGTKSVRTHGLLLEMWLRRDTKTNSQRHRKTRERKREIMRKCCRFRDFLTLWTSLIICSAHEGFPDSSAQQLVRICFVLISSHLFIITTKLGSNAKIYHLWITRSYARIIFVTAHSHVIKKFKLDWVFPSANLFYMSMVNLLTDQRLTRLLSNWPGWPGPAVTRVSLWIIFRSIIYGKVFYDGHIYLA